MVVLREETTMDWLNRFRAPVDAEIGRRGRYAEPADPADETVINGAPFDPQNASRSGQESLAAPRDGDREVTEEIRRRQISAVVRYVAAVRAR
jgi:hypothetical protein